MNLEELYQASDFIWLQLLGSLLKGVAILLVAALMSFILRRKSAELRHRIWAIGTFGALIVPLIALLLPETARTKLAFQAQIDFGSSATSTSDSSLLQTTSSAESAPIVGKLGEQRYDSSTGASSTLLPSASSSTNASYAKNVQSWGTYHWRALVLLVWFGGTAMLFSRWMLAVYGQYRFKSSLKCIQEPTCLELIEEVQRTLGLHHRVFVIESSDQSVPVVTGFFRPYVILPCHWQSWTTCELRCVLLHELAHLWRGDLIAQTMSCFLICFYWFNPLAWYARRQLAIEREFACDDHVLNTQVKPSEYAASLLSVLQHCLRNPHPLGIAIPVSGRFNYRIQAILDAARPRFVQPVPFVIVAWSLSLLVTSFLAGLTISNRSSLADDRVHPTVASSSEKTFRISGRVVDEEGKSIEGAVATLQCRSRSEPIQVVTDRNGDFEIHCPHEPPVGRGDPFLWVQAINYNLKCVRPQKDDNEYLPCEVVLRMPLESLRIRVLDEDGNECPHVTLKPYHYDVPNGVFYSERSTGLFGIVPDVVAKSFSFTTDAEGWAELKGLPRNKLSSLSCSTEKILPQILTFNGDGQTVRLRSTGSLIGRAVCNVKDAPSIDWTECQVFVTTKWLVMKQSKENPFAQGFEARCFQKVQLDAEGGFTLDGVMAGQLSLQLNLNGSSGLVPMAIPLKSLIADKSLEVEMEIVKGLRVEGTIVTEDDEPVPFTKLVFQGIDASFHHTVSTDINGKYESFLPPGEFQVQAFDMSESKLQDDYGYPKSLKVVVLSETDSDVIPAMTCPRIFRENGQLQDASGKPLANRRVALLATDTNHAMKFGTSDAAGVLRLTRGPELPGMKLEWVLYPVNHKSIEGDARDYPRLRVQSESPLVLVADE